MTRKFKPYKFADSAPLTNEAHMHEFESILNCTKNIEKLRWIDISEGRWYRFSISIRETELEAGLESWALIEGPVRADANWCRLSDQGLEIANRLIALKGIRVFEVRKFDIIVRKEDTASWCDLHSSIVKVINDVLFSYSSFNIEETQSDPI